VLLRSGMTSATDIVPKTGEVGSRGSWKLNPEIAGEVGVDVACAPCTLLIVGKSSKEEGRVKISEAAVELMDALFAWEVMAKKYFVKKNARLSGDVADK
jgi:hypothetical protein